MARGFERWRDWITLFGMFVLPFAVVFVGTRFALALHHAAMIDAANLDRAFGVAYPAAVVIGAASCFALKTPSYLRRIFLCACYLFLAVPIAGFSHIEARCAARLGCDYLPRGSR